jgi:guanylate kinase
VNGETMTRASAPERSGDNEETTRSVASAEADLVSDQLGEHADELIADLRVLRKPRMFIISGPSGVGKDTVIEALRVRFPDAYFAVTATTRQRRPGEIDGVHYYFMDHDSFESRHADGEFLESAWVYGHRYGVPRGPIRAALARAQDVFVKVDIQGSESIRGLVPDATSIFLAPESMASLLQRLRSRKTDDPEALMNRFGTASRELASARDFDYVIFNESDRVEQAVECIAAVVTAERFRTLQPGIAV